VKPGQSSNDLAALQAPASTSAQKRALQDDWSGEKPQEEHSQ